MGLLIEQLPRQSTKFRTVPGRAGGRTRREDDRDDPRDVSQSPPNGDQYGRQKGGRGRLIGRTKGGMNTKLQAIYDSQGRPIYLFVTAGQVSDYIGARALLSGLPKVKWLLGDRGYDADWFREALQDKGIRTLPRRAVVAVARKLAVLLHRMWADGTEFRPAQVEGTA